MQSTPTLQRHSQSSTRSQTPTDSHRTSTPNMEASQASGTQPRTSSASVRPHGSRSTNPDKQISQIEKSVTHLLVATKQLLETLTQWSRGNAQEEEVSDVYVRLGYEFNLACRAFNSIGVDTSDLGPVPDLLRSILEDTLSQPASPQALDNFLPRIRDIIINLLHGLKRKQSKLRSKAPKDAGSKSQVVPPRQSSVGSISSNETGLTQLMEGVPSQASSVRSESRQESVFSKEEQNWPADVTTGKTPFDKTSVHRQSTRPTGRQLVNSDSNSTVINKSRSDEFGARTTTDKESASTLVEAPFPHPPPPPPKQDALTALQRGGDLERRASRRFSAYQISKHLGASSNGVPVIPAAQNSPIPNRGREVRESMSAVRSRASYQNTRQKSSSRLAESASNNSDIPRQTARISEEREELVQESKEEAPVFERPSETAAPVDSPTIKTPDEFEGPSEFGNGAYSIGATLNGPLSPTPEQFIVPQSPDPEVRTQRDPSKTDGARIPATQADDESPEVSTPRQSNIASNIDSSPPQGRELTLFLQYKSKIKKFVLGDGYEELTMARLQLAFIEKFNWHTHNNGIDLPEIYIQDLVSGVRHELEDLNDVKDRSVLVLNIEVLDEVKKHFDEGLGGLKATIEDVRSLLNGQGSMMQRFSDRQLESAKEMARLSAVPAPRPSRTTTTASSSSGKTSPSETSMTEVQNLRRDIAVLRQTYSTMSSDFAAAMKDIKAKAEGVKTVAHQAAAPSYDGDAGRAHVNAGKRTLNTESELLVNRVDDLSDAVEDLRKDVVTRGVRPLPRQLEELNREISATARDLTKMKEFMKREKPIWTKIWEQELNLVCTERDDLTQQEDLMQDLDGDLEDVTGVFKLVEEAMKQQNLQGNGQVSLRSGSKALEIDTTGVDPHAAKDGVLGEVRALQPNHEGRLEAIERAEKLRQKELESRKVGEFQREVENFVEEGKLRKTGGMEEVERLRKIKDERARKENFDRQQARAAEMERKRAEEAAAALAAATEERNRNSEDSTNTTFQNTAAVESNQISQEGENGFQEALGGKTASAPTPDSLSLQTLESVAPSVISPDVTEISHSGTTVGRLSQDLPPLPEASKSGSDDGRKIDSDTTSTSNPDRQSWWKPAMFATNS